MGAKCGGKERTTKRCICWKEVAMGHDQLTLPSTNTPMHDSCFEGCLCGCVRMSVWLYDDVGVMVVWWW